VTPSLGNKKAQIMLHFSCWEFYCQSAETAPDFHQPNDWRKRWDLVSRRNLSSEEAALVYDGRLFHARAAATETRGHWELIDRLMAPASSESRQSADGDEQQPLMSAVGCQLDTPVLCRAHSDMPEHNRNWLDVAACCMMTSILCVLISSSSAIDGIRAVMIVSKISRKITRTVV